jgi:iron complex transport system permease protein
VVLAAVVGAALTTAGTVVQALVRNALADPFLLGVSSGASVGATAVLLFGAFASLGVWALSLGSLLGALAAMAAVFVVSRTGRQLAPTQLILCGVVLSALFESVTSFLIFRGNPQATQSVLFWLLGSFGNANWTQLPIPAVAFLWASSCLTSSASWSAPSTGGCSRSGSCSERRSWCSATCWPAPSWLRKRCRSVSSPRSSAPRP